LNVLITGAGGFIGRHLVRDQLSRGRNVTAVDVDLAGLESLPQSPALKAVEMDFRDPELEGQLSGQDVCFHLASLHLEVGAREEEFKAVNVEGARQFVERCYRAQVGRFVHCSSVGVFGDVRNPPADEDSECRPGLAYERSKLDGERRVREFAERTGFPVVVVRPSWVYGPGCPRTMKLARTIQAGRFFYVGSGSTLRHPIHIDDILSGFELAATHPSAVGEVFIMAGPRAVPIRELVGALARQLGVKPPNLRLPRLGAWLGGLMLEAGFGAVGREPPFSRRSLKFFTGNTAFRTEKARRLLGFVPRVELEEGLRRTLRELAHSGGL